MIYYGTLLLLISIAFAVGALAFAARAGVTKEPEVLHPDQAETAIFSMLLAGASVASAFTGGCLIGGAL